VAGNRVFIAANDSRSDQGRFEWDVYDQPLYCSGDRIATVYVVDLTSLALIAKSEHRGKEIRGLLVTPGGPVVAAGTLIDDCATRAQSQLIVATIEHDGSMRIVFSEQNSYRSRGTGLFIGPGDTYFVLGQSDRVFNTERPPSLDQLKNYSFELLRRKDRVELRDALVLQFDSKGSIVNRSVVSGGVSFALNSGVYVDGRVIAAGTFGIEWGWLEYEVR
jgi:hypothetical protein